MQKKKVKAKVFRWNPELDAAPKYVEYEVPWRKYLTVLEILRYIYENFDSIAFDYSCRSMLCGKCGVQVNGKPVLACVTFVEPCDITIAPLKGLPVIRDLKVDRSMLELRSFRNKPELQRIKPVEEKLKPEILPLNSVQKCMELFKCRSCYLCHAACPVVEFSKNKFCGPALIVKIGLRVYDPRDEADRLMEAVNEGLWLCTLCSKCKEVCPREIDVPALIRDLRKKCMAKRVSLPAKK